MSYNKEREIDMYLIHLKIEMDMNLLESILKH